MGEETTNQSSEGMRDKANSIGDPKINIGVRLLLIASVLVLFLATATELYTAPKADHIPKSNEKSTTDLLIVPGVRVGPVSLGYDESKLRELLGVVGKLRVQEPGRVHLFEEIGLAVYCEQNRVVSVTVRSGFYHTRSGLRVGSKAEEALKLLEGDYETEGNGEEYNLHNWQQGWHVGVKDDTVQYIQISAFVEGG